MMSPKFNTQAAERCLDIVYYIHRAFGTSGWGFGGSNTSKHSLIYTCHTYVMVKNDKLVFQVDTIRTEDIECVPQ